MGSAQRPALQPTLPVNDPCLSYWQRTSRAFPYLHANRIAPVPAKSKYTVIGSGIAGALTAFELIQRVEPGEVLILEAREAASGASSRNAGHVRPDAFRGYQYYSKLHGSEQALKIIEDERSVLQKLDEFVKTHNVPCDFHLTTTFDVCMTPDFAAYEEKSFQEYKAAGGDTTHVKFYSGSEAQEKTGVKLAISAYEWPAGSSHPAKLAQWLLAAVIEKGAKLYTHCPALSISTQESESESTKLWKISTPRGEITVEKIIHCTNAYADFLLPQLGPLVTPNRAQAHSLIATPSFSGSNALDRTFSLRYSLNHFYSLIQRREDGTLILGVSRTNPTLSPETLATTETFDDRYFNQEIVEDAIRQFALIYPNYWTDEFVHGEGMEHPWTGIIGMTGDHVPFVGEIEELSGQYICAGFNGHGMARIFNCAPGVAKLVLGKGWNETGLPECFQFSKERLWKISARKT